jgi:hypothetical protein
VVDVSKLILVCLIAITSAEPHNFEVFRLAQYDKGSSQCGSRRSTLNQQATTVSKDNVRSSRQGDLARKVVVLTMQDVSIDMLAYLIDVLKAGGVLVVVPDDLSTVRERTSADWVEEGGTCTPPQRDQDTAALRPGGRQTARDGGLAQGQ